MNSLDILVLGHLERNEDGSVDLNNTWSTSTLIRTDDGHNIVVDTSMQYMKSGIKTSFKQIGKIFPDDVDMIVLTHAHPDHIGNCSMFKNAKIYVRKEELEHVPDAIGVDSDREIAKGVKLVHTPGHSPGSMSVFVEADRKYVIAGDAMPLADNYHKMVPPKLNYDEDLAMESMKRIIVYADVIIPGHDKPFTVRKR